MKECLAVDDLTLFTSNVYRMPYLNIGFRPCKFHNADMVVIVPNIGLLHVIIFGIFRQGWPVGDASLLKAYGICLVSFWTFIIYFWWFCKIMKSHKRWGSSTYRRYIGFYIYWPTNEKCTFFFREPALLHQFQVINEANQGEKKSSATFAQKIYAFIYELRTSFMSVLNNIG